MRFSVAHILASCSRMAFAILPLGVDNIVMISIYAPDNTVKSFSSGTDWATLP